MKLRDSELKDLIKQAVAVNDVKYYDRCFLSRPVTGKQREECRLRRDIMSLLRRVEELLE